MKVPRMKASHLKLRSASYPPQMVIQDTVTLFSSFRFRIHTMFGLYLSFLLFGIIYAEQQSCSMLRDLNTAYIGFATSDCDCTSGADTVSDACTSCFNGASYKGTAQSTSVLNTTGATYSQQTDVELCFYYEGDTYGGAKVCYSYVLFGSNPQSQCTVTVDGAQCAACQTATTTTLAFDCSNLSYRDSEGKSSVFQVRQDAPVAEAVDGTLLQFLNGATSSEGCEPVDLGNGGSGGSDASMTTFLSAFFIVAATSFATLL
eukprot:scaffold683_cov124-Cylindrotheca_fusiformis.AAC.36